MAKFGAYYGLCPLIDHRSLLGVSRDEENGLVVVTLGKNIAIKYKLSDQKQIHSWRTKVKFTSPIIYDSAQSKYCAVFNQTFVRCWTGNEEFLDKLKKLKFKSPIHTLFTCNNRSFIVFQNGVVTPLIDALENRKELNLEAVIDPGTCISDLLYAPLQNDIYVGLVVKSDNGSFLHWTMFGEASSQSEWYKIIVHTPGSVLSGYTFHSMRDSVNFFCLWSDSRLTSLKLDSQVSQPELLAIVDSLSCKNSVAIASLDPNYLAMYGSNANEEGAMLIIYNVQFKVTQSKQQFKLFTDGAKLWTIQDDLFLPVGQHLAVVPFRLDTEQLAALVGSHRLANLDPDVSIVQQINVHEWTKNQPEQPEVIADTFNEHIAEYVTQGLPENAIFDQILADLLRTKNVNILIESLQHFQDVSEESLSKCLKFALDSNESGLLAAILQKSFNEMILLPHLRKDLDMKHVTTLIAHFSSLLNGEHPADIVLVNWCCVILDANYQKFLLSKDEAIKESITTFNKLINEQLASLEHMLEVAPVLQELISGRSLKKTCISNSYYSIEDVGFYE